MVMGDFISLAERKVPVKVVVFNNGTLGFVEPGQKSTAFSTTEPSLTIRTSPQSPRRSVSAGSLSLIPPPSIAEALAHDGPVLVDAVGARTERAMPLTIIVEMAKSFTLYMVKAIMNGRGDEIIDLAKTNLWR